MKTYRITSSSGLDLTIPAELFDYRVFETIQSAVIANVNDATPIVRTVVLDNQAIEIVITMV